MLPKRKAARTGHSSSSRRLVLAVVVGVAFCLWGLVAALLFATATTTSSDGETTNKSTGRSADDENKKHPKRDREMQTISRPDHDDKKKDIYKHGAPPVIGTRVTLTPPGSDRTTELVYALPAMTTTTTTTNNNNNDIQGIALLLHGCSHSALKFFSPSSPACPSCIGLSEELQISRLLLQQQTLAVVAVTSQDRSRGCWSLRDIPHIQDALQYVLQQVLQGQGQGHIPPSYLPVLAFGASSGGRFAAQLAVRQLVDAAMVGVMSLGHDLAQKWRGLEDNNNNNNSQRPPIYLAPMPRDKRTTAGANQDFEMMVMTTMKDATSHPLPNGNPLPKNPVRLDVTTCVPLPVTASYLNQRVPQMTHTMAEMIVTALVTSSHMDAASGLLLQDPTQSNWRDILREQCADQGCLENQPLGPGVSPLAKALHRCWAFHEYCSEATLKALEFFQQELGGTAFFHP